MVTSSVQSVPRKHLTRDCLVLTVPLELDGGGVITARVVLTQCPAERILRVLVSVLLLPTD